MGRERDPGLGLDWQEGGGGIARLGRIGKDDGAGVPDGEGVLDAQLVAEFGPDASFTGKRFGQLRPQAVVPAAGIPDAQDKDRQRDLDATVSPAASTSSTERGIAPRACVAQLRHGS